MFFLKSPNLGDVSRRISLHQAAAQQAALPPGHQDDHRRIHARPEAAAAGAATAVQAAPVRFGNAWRAGAMEGGPFVGVNA